MSDQIVFFVGGTTLQGVALGGLSQPLDYDAAEMFSRVRIWTQVTPEVGFFMPMMPGFNTSDRLTIQGFGYETGFAINWLEEHDEGTLYIGKYTPGANNFYHTTLAPLEQRLDWSPQSNGELFDTAGKIVNAMLQASGLDSLDGLFVSLGGMDGNSPALGAAYGNNFAEFSTAARAEWMHDPDGYIGFTFTSPDIGSVVTGNQGVRDGQALVDSLDNQVEGLETAGFEMLPGNEFFTADATLEIGKGLFDNFWN